MTLLGGYWLQLFSLPLLIRVITSKNRSDGGRENMGCVPLIESVHRSYCCASLENLNLSSNVIHIHSRDIRRSGGGNRRID